MSQHGEAVDVARSEDIRHIRAQLGVRLDGAAHRLHADRLQSEIGRHGAAAYAHEDLLARGRGRVALCVDIDHLITAHLRHLARESELDATLGVHLAQHDAHLTVESAEDLGQHLYDGHLRAEAVVEAGELHADHAATDDDDRLGAFLESQYFAVGYDHVARLGYAGDGRHEGLGTGAEQEVLCFVCLAVALDRQRAVFLPACDACLALDDIHAVCLHRCADAGHEFAYDLVLAGYDLAVVKRSALGRDAILVAVAGVVVHLGAVEQRLRGHAALVEADAAEVVLLKERYAQSFRSGALGSHIAGRPASNDC